MVDFRFILLFNLVYQAICRINLSLFIFSIYISIYLGVLGVESTCGESEIRKAYFKKSKEYHPDRHAVSTAIVTFWAIFFRFSGNFGIFTAVSIMYLAAAFAPCRQKDADFFPRMTP